MTVPSDNIILIGMPGAGKSTLGVVLAKMLNMNFVDADIVIQGAYGKTLQRLIDERGAEGFISIENSVLASLKAENSVIATGGSAVYSDEAMLHLASIGTVVYLEISYESLIERLGDLEERGVVLRNGSSTGLRGLFDERMPLYERYASVTIDVDNLSITEAARKVASRLPHQMR